MIRNCLFGLFLFLCFAQIDCRAESRIKIERNEKETGFLFRSIPLPAVNDYGSKCQLRVLKGKTDPNAGSLSRLNDGELPRSEDSPQENFFFSTTDRHGFIEVDLKTEIEVTQIATYSWHPSSRAPQLYRVFGSATAEVLPPQSDLSESTLIDSGWKQIASVDSRSVTSSGGQIATLIDDDRGSLGKFRFLIFSIDATDPNDTFSNTFFSEIDIVSAQDLDLKRTPSAEKSELRFTTLDERYTFSVDISLAPDLQDWTIEELKPVICSWYPKIVELLPSEGYSAPSHVHFRYRLNSEMNGTPAYAQGNTITLNADWFRRELKREARGSVVHEMAHVVQSYQGRRQRGERRRSTPGWIVEGIPDYIRWFLYEPESKGAIMSTEALKKAKHDASYRISGNFIDWVIRNYDPDHRFLKELNAAAREGKYSEDIWHQLTGKSESELAKEWNSQ